MHKGKRARIAVIGTGWWATQYHLPALLANGAAEVVALCDPDVARLAAAVAHFNISDSFRDHRQLFAATQLHLDGVVIAVPHAFHYRIARDALDTGFHVLVEKPMALRSSHAWDLVRRAADRRLNLVVGYTYQYSPYAKIVRDTIRAGDIGDLLLVSGLFASMVEAYYRGRPDQYAPVMNFPVTGPAASTYSDPSLSGGGQGQTQVTHAMGMVLWATGRRATEVTSFMQALDLSVDLADAMAYRLDDGSIGTMASTGSLRPGQTQQQELRYYGSQGFVLQEIVKGRLSIHLNDGTARTFPELQSGDVYPAGATSACLVDLIQGRGENLSPGDDGARVVEFLEAAYRSVEERRPVAIEELDSESLPDDQMGALLTPRGG